MKLFLMAGLLLASAALSAGDVIAQWDFTTGKTTSVDGKLKGTLRGATRITKDENGKSMLTIGMTNNGEGIIFKSQDIPHVEINSPFRIEAQVQVREQTAKGYYMCIYDCNYINNPKRITPDAAGGFTFQLDRTKNDKLRLMAWIGHGNSLDYAFGKPFEMEEYKNFTVAMEYDNVKTVRFYVNGKLNREVKVKHGGPVGKIFRGPSLGDRIGSGYNRFDGSILKLTISKLPKK